MRAKTKSEPQPGGCMAPTPPWTRARTKQAAYQVGFERGFNQGQVAAKEDLRHKAASLEEGKIKLDALKNICQAGSSIAEAMSKALLSLNNHL